MKIGKLFKGDLNLIWREKFLYFYLLYANKINKKPKIIYFKYIEEKASIQWIDDSTVIINNVKLHLPNDKYVKK